MPTFKNETKHYIDYEAKNVLVSEIRIDAY